MLVSVNDLVRRLRGPRLRSNEVAAARRRIAAGAREDTTEEEVTLAHEMRELRPAIAAAFASVRSCSGCATSRPLPHGRWEGGFCCGGPTSGVFDDDESAVLALAGTRPRDLRPPPGDHAGCAFRGPQGCSLRPEDRPSLCLRFVCRALEGELRAAGRWDHVRTMTRRLDEAFARFVRVRRARRETSS
ncbi:MAG: hypothetical protein M3O36_09225 [Myxococcota bacterium]|nr:hypothetical protein [Myxococcota bacterium]